MVWGDPKDGQFTVKFSQNGMFDKWPWKYVWKIKRPPKAT